MKNKWENAKIEELDVQETKAGGSKPTEDDGNIYQIVVNGQLREVEEQVPDGLSS